MAAETRLAAPRAFVSALLVGGLVVGASLLAACSDDEGGTPTTFVKLDGSPRVPDREGIVTDLADDLSTLEIDGERFEVSPALQSFATTDGSTRALRSTLDEYVHAGLRGRSVAWIAAIADVLHSSDGDVVFYVGGLQRIDDGRAYFDDGTVLRLAPGVDDPRSGATAGKLVEVTAQLDPSRDLVVELRAS
jgi:hypothetical protein